MNVYHDEHRSWVQRHPILFALLIFACLLLCSCILLYIVASSRLMAVSVPNTPQSLVQNVTLNGHVTLVGGTSLVTIDETLDTWAGTDARVEIEEDCFTLQGTIWQNYQQASSVYIQFYNEDKQHIGHCLVSAHNASSIAWASMRYQDAWNLYDIKSFSG